MENKNATSRAAGSKSNSLLEKFFVDSLKDIYWAEKHLVKALNKMQKNATDQQLKSAFEQHRGQTEEHVSRLEQVFEKMGKKAMGKKCEAMEGLTAEAEEVMEQTKDDTETRDAALIISAQKAEHYEIATYGGLVQLAKTLQQQEIAGILAQTLQEEKETDQKLTQIAESTANVQAAQE